MNNSNNDDNGGYKPIHRLTPQDIKNEKIDLIYKFKKLENVTDQIIEVRGVGLMLGIKTKDKNGYFAIQLVSIDHESKMPNIKKPQKNLGFFYNYFLLLISS